MRRPRAGCADLRRRLRAYCALLRLIAPGCADLRRRLRARVRRAPSLTPPPTRRVCVAPPHSLRPPLAASLSPARPVHPPRPLLLLPLIPRHLIRVVLSESSYPSRISLAASHSQAHRGRAARGRRSAAAPCCALLRLVAPYCALLRLVAPYCAYCALLCLVALVVAAAQVGWVETVAALAAAHLLVVDWTPWSLS